ncbi:Hypothetical predicted protein [Mytilus galloprovincialis]|uniref:Uncharacterized protein n=1 Tax=Mytilus galloprovincialis TaxID=29158 RepID=A0A8B6BZF7_MYTGA|nr:Hypothetical predicted protein [Mytilus galloprovincialis]
MPNVIDQIIKSNEYKENVKFEEKESINFEIMFETPKKQRFEPKLFSEKRNTFNLIHSVTEQKIKSHESIEDVKHEKKESISFDIMFETPKKQRSNMSKARLTSCKTKTQFQSKPSIDGKKDKNHGQEHKEEKPTTADKKGRNSSIDENRIASPSGMATLPPIANRSDLYNQTLSGSGFRKLPPINNTSKTTMDRPMSSARLSFLFIAKENKLPVSALDHQNFHQL